jgi:quinol monooxygenase YgiN
MYGLLGRVLAMPGKRDELASILVPGEGGMPGCLTYIVAEDPANADALWVTEVWTDQAAHRASLQSPAVQAAIARAGR